MSEREAELLEQARAGDLDAFADLVRLLERRVRAVLGRLLDDERDVDEAAQDTFVQAWRNLDRFRGGSAPFTWIYRIAVNEALQRTRRKRLPTTPLDEQAELASRPSPPVEDEVEARDEATFVAARLRALRAELRIPVVLRDVLGWSNEEVAEALGVSVSAAKSRVHRGRMQLRDELEQWEAGRFERR